MARYLIHHVGTGFAERSPFDGSWQLTIGRYATPFTTVLQAEQAIYEIVQQGVATLADLHVVDERGVPVTQPGSLAHRQTA